MQHAVHFCRCRGCQGIAEGWHQRRPFCFPVILTWDAKSTYLLMFLRWLPGKAENLACRGFNCYGNRLLGSRTLTSTPTRSFSAPSRSSYNIYICTYNGICQFDNVQPCVALLPSATPAPADCQGTLCDPIWYRKSRTPSGQANGAYGTRWWPVPR